LAVSPTESGSASALRDPLALLVSEDTSSQSQVVYGSRG